MQQSKKLTMPLGLANSRLIWLAMSVAFSGYADASVLTPLKKGMQIGCAQVHTCRISTAVSTRRSKHSNTDGHRRQVVKPIRNSSLICSGSYQRMTCLPDAGQKLIAASRLVSTPG